MNESNPLHPNLHHPTTALEIPPCQLYYKGRDDQVSPNDIIFFLLVNVHLVFGDWKEPDVNAMQAALFFQQLHDILPPYSKHNTPWIVCGDFNVRPNFPAYELVRNGRLSPESMQRLSPAKCKYPQMTENNKVRGPS